MKLLDVALHLVPLDKVVRKHCPILDMENVQLLLPLMLYPMTKHHYEHHNLSLVADQSVPAVKILKKKFKSKEIQKSFLQMW